MRKLILAVVSALPLSLAGAALADSPDAQIERRIESILGQMTQEEKIDLLGGVNLFDVRGVPRVGLPTMLAADGPFGVRRFARSTVIPGGIALAATWNTELAERIGVQIGRDARARGVHFYLAPGVNIYRSPLNGRNFEYLGEDPYLAARIAVNFIEGVQSQGVAATVKHYLGNNSEFARHTTDSVIDERTAREIYLPTFEAAVREAKVAAVMSGYNLVNGEHMTQSRHFNLDVLKGEWGFRGVFMSDWDATYDTLAAANGGLDLEMPSGKFLNREALLPLIRDGKVKQATIDDKVRRILRTAAQLGWLDRPQLDPSIPRYNAAGREAALQAAREAIVLLKNQDDVLPLDRTKTRTIALIGPNAYPAVPHGGGSVSVSPFRSISLLEGLSDTLGTKVEVKHVRGIVDPRRAAAATKFSIGPDGREQGLKVEVFHNLDLSGAPVSTRTDRSINQGAPLDATPFTTGDVDLDLSVLTPVQPASTRWTGYYTPAQAGNHDIFMHVGGFAREVGYRLYIDDKLVTDRWTRKISPLETTRVALDARPHKVVLEHRTHTGRLDGSVPFARFGIVREGTWTDPVAEQLASQADAVILAVGFDAASETEDWDRTFDLPPGQDELIRRIASLNKNTVVVMTSGGAVDMSGWLDQVPGLLQAWYLGQEGGIAVAEVLFGSVNPSGKLPATFERRWQDNPAHDYYYPKAPAQRVAYEEGVFVGYRGYERRGIQPQFPFGHGLSYTSFGYSDLTIAPSTEAGRLYDVSFTVKNTGSRAGAAVTQLYVADPKSDVPRPPKELKGFAKVQLRPGESQRVTLPLDARSLAFYDVAAKAWRAQAGDFRVHVGDSTQSIALTGELKLPRSIVVRE
jgi:beta-glucosidase